MRLFSLFVSLCNAQYYSPYKIDNNDATGIVNVTLKEGTIFGLSFGDFDVYRGVPYGQAGRFEMATPIKDLKNFNATNWGPTCFQSPGWFSTEPIMGNGLVIIKNSVTKVYSLLEILSSLRTQDLSSSVFFNK